MIGSSFTLYLDSSDSINNMKYLIYRREGCSPEQQRLVFGGNQLEDDKTLADYNIKKDSFVHLVLRLRF